MKAVIQSRVGKLLDCLTDAPPPQVEQTRHTLICRFPHSPRFPATATIEFGVTRDGDARNVAVEYDLHILPAFVPVNARAHLVMPHDAVDEAKVAAWVEEQILCFVDAYLKTETVQEYQDENLVTDPVCGMRINKLSAASEAEYRGVKHFFCTEQCRRQFEEDPDRYNVAKTGAAT